jgi:beta-galactosidase
MLGRRPVVARRLLIALLLGVTPGLTAIGLLGGSAPVDPWRASDHRKIALNDAWRFHAGDASGAENPGFDDSSWAQVEVPHDWSIAGPRTHGAPTGMAGGFAPTGLGWYRRIVHVPDTWKGQTIWLVFEGVYMNAQIWLNGQAVGLQRYGYTSFIIDLTPYVKTGADHLLAVRVDNSAQPNSRWYSGSGIYRPVWLEAADAVHIAARGVSVTTESATSDRALVRVQTSVVNDTGRKRKVILETRLLAPAPDDTVLVTQSSSVVIAGGGSSSFVHDLPLDHPALWSPDSPTLYRIVSRAIGGGNLADVVNTTIGVRTVRVSPDRGFELNGQTIKLHGANLHHDLGPLGAASYPDAERRRVRLLKAAGFNAVRTAHNPPAPAFLDACDELGLLVMDEAFDCWKEGKNPADYSVWFNDWWQRDLDAMVLRDRNHPSVVMWSIGNEVREKGTPEGVTLAKTLAKRVRELDPTRIVTCGWNNPWEHHAEWADLDPMFAALDLAGYNYEHARAAADHARVPSRVMLATESYQSDTFVCWAVAQDHPYFVGDFVWSGMDYLGESGIGRVFPPGAEVKQHWEMDHWPWFGAYCGDLDITGWRKPISHYRNIVWDRGEKLYVAVQAPPPAPGAWQPTLWAMPPTLDSWTWPGSEGRSLTAEVYSRHESVKLFLNDRLIGEKPTTRDGKFEAVFEVPYEPGTLRAVGIDSGRETETRVLETAGPAAGVRLRPDWNDEKLRVTDPTFAIAEIVDAAGRWVPTSSVEINFSASDGAKVIAVGTGDMTTSESYVATSRRAWHGRALVIVRPAPAADGKRTLIITATVPDLNGASDSLSVDPTPTP